MKNETLLIIADSASCADMLYATGLFVPDPFIYLNLRGQSFLVMSDLEIDRARRQAPHCEVLSLSEYEGKLKGQGLERWSLAEVAHRILKEHRVRRVVVPMSFPLGLARRLEALKIQIEIRDGQFFPCREFKTPAEVRKIRQALQVTEEGIRAGLALLRKSRITPTGFIEYRGHPLTSERLRAEIDSAILHRGGVATDTIVAGGNQACDPHERGHGKLRAHRPIIIDVFPRMQISGFHGDITRTVVKGRASDKAHAIYAAVEKAQATALACLKPGVTTLMPHQLVHQTFTALGFETKRHRGRMQGFFHGTGHGLGLEIHEQPRLGAQTPGTLQPGHVITVEPGLYYFGIGGVRLEDVVVITRSGFRNLVSLEKVFEI